MKTILALTAILLNTSAFAIDNSGNSDTPSITYVSWCVNGKVMAENDQGEMYEKMNCASLGKKCIQKEQHTGAGVVGYAICK